MRILIFALAMLTSANAWADKAFNFAAIDIKWSNRALKAVDNMDELVKNRSTDGTVAGLPNKDLQQFYIEHAYSNHLNPKLAGIVKKKLNGMVFYHLTVAIDGERDKMIGIVFAYNGESESPAFVRFDHIPSTTTISSIPVSGTIMTGISDSTIPDSIIIFAHPEKPFSVVATE